MEKFLYNRALIAVIFIGLIASLTICIDRHYAEEKNRTIDLAMDYSDLEFLARHDGIEMKDIMRQAKEAGITSLAVYERTFKELNITGAVHAYPGSEILSRYGSGMITDAEWLSMIRRGEILSSNIYITGADRTVFDEVKSDLIRRIGSDRVRSFTIGSGEILEVRADYKSLEKMNLGLPTEEMKSANEAGFTVIARPSNYLKADDDDVDFVFERINGADVSAIIFSGSEALGARKSITRTIEKLNERGIILGLIEATSQLQFYPQDGLLEIAKATGYNAARVYAIPKDEQPKMKIPVAVARWTNTDEERNIRINLLRAFEKPEQGSTLTETNISYIKAVRDSLAAKGFSFGRAGVFEPFNVSPALRAVVVAGVTAAGVLYLTLVIPALNRRPKLQMIIFVVITAVATIPVIMGYGGKIRLFASIVSANVFPALAIIWMLDRIREKNPIDYSLFRTICGAVLALFVTGALSMTGAAYLSGVLSDVEYFLEVNIFRGIKLTFIMPMILVAVAFLQRFDVVSGSDNAEGVFMQFKKILNMPVKVETLFILFIGLLAGVILIARSGHSMGMPVSGLEIKFRQFLEHAMYARPRSKELLIGHPAFMLAALAWSRKWPTMIFFLLVIVATIGQGSMVETFAHMRTPVMMSFARGIGGLVLAVIPGVIAITAAEMWQWILKRQI